MRAVNIPFRFSLPIGKEAKIGTDLKGKQNLVTRRGTNKMRNTHLAKGHFKNVDLYVYDFYDDDYGPDFGTRIMKKQNYESSFIEEEGYIV